LLQAFPDLAFRQSSFYLLSILPILKNAENWVPFHQRLAPRLPISPLPRKILMPAVLASSPSPSLSNPVFLRRVNSLRTLDNSTNWLYLVREYLFLGLVAGSAVAFFYFRESWELSWPWNIPVALLAIVLVGAGQHRLTTLGHEASHYMLFRNRRLNELISDFFCMFPVWSTTHFYRLQHLAHHQFPNDPERDPDVTQMEASGHRFKFPMSAGRFVWECVIKQILWIPGLIRYVR